MAIDYSSGLETHPAGSVDINAIVNGNWEQLDAMFNSAYGLTASQAGTTVTASASVFVSDDVGASIRFADGTTRVIDAYTAADEVEVTVSGTKSAQSFKLYRTDQSQYDALARAIFKVLRMTAAMDGKVPTWSDALGRFVPGTGGAGGGGGGVGDSEALSNGVDNGSVSYAFGASPPLAVTLTIESPSGSGGRSAWLVGAPTSTGFDWAMSAPTDNTNYRLHWTAVLEATS